MVSHIKRFLKAATFIEALLKQQIQEAESIPYQQIENIG
jgi:hypothetical protein